MNRMIVAALVLICALSCSFVYAQEEKPAATVQILEAKLGKAVENREIVGEAAAFTLNEKAYLWLKVAGAEGELITVTWKHGEHSFSTELSVGGSPWRTWAYKTVAMAGEWSVSVADKDGNVLNEMTFSVSEEGK